MPTIHNCILCKNKCFGIMCKSCQTNQFKNKKKEYTCQNCGRTFIGYVYRKSKVCSKKCLANYMSKHLPSKIIDEYLMNKSITELSKKYNCSEETIRRYFHKKGIALQKSVFKHCKQFKPKTLTNVEKSYIAGLFDGEGCIYHNPDKMWSVCIANTDRKVITWLYNKLGGAIYKKFKIYKGSKHRVLYWSFGKQKAIYWFLKQIKSYSIIKSRKINLAIKNLSVMDKYKNS